MALLIVRVAFGKKIVTKASQKQASWHRRNALIAAAMAAGARVSVPIKVLHSTCGTATRPTTPVVACQAVHTREELFREPSHLAAWIGKEMAKLATRAVTICRGSKPAHAICGVWLTGE